MIIAISVKILSELSIIYAPNKDFIKLLLFVQIIIFQVAAFGFISPAVEIPRP